MVALSIVTTIIRDGYRAPLVRAFILFALGIMLWNGAYALMTLSENKDSVRAIYRISSIAWGASPSIAMYYAYRLLCEYDARPYSSRLGILIFTPLPFIWYGIFYGKILAYDFERSGSGWIEMMDPSSLWNYAFLLIIFAGMVAFAFIGLRLSSISHTNRARLHGLLITLPITVMIILVLVFHIVLPMARKQIFPPTIQILLGLWIVVISLILQKYPVFSLSPRIAADVIVNSMSDMCFLSDSGGMVIGANPAVGDLLGRESASLIGRPLGDIFPAEICAALTDVADQAGARRTMEALLQPADGTALPCVVSLNAIRDSLRDPVGFVLIAHEIREEKRLKLLSETDVMTGVYNRRKMEAVIAEVLAEPRKQLRTFCVIMIDIDMFKAVNDRFGHDAGDKVIMDLCDIVRRSTRGNDLFARWGGEEFLIFCRYTDEAEAMLLSERIRSRLERHSFSHGATVTASFGIAQALEGDTVESLVKRSDQALYRAKAEGRNKVSL
ncbi:MAG: diguanylate cyclase [Treponemataceae bacterium]